jgi:hypothetical protein
MFRKKQKFLRIGNHIFNSDVIVYIEKSKECINVHLDKISYYCIKCVDEQESQKIFESLSLALKKA